MSTRNKALIAAIFIMTAAISPALAIGGHGNHHPSSDQEQTAAFPVLIDNYLAIQTALAGDSIEGVSDRAGAIRTIARDLAESFDPSTAGVDEKNSAALMKTLPALSQAAGDLSRAGNIQEARTAFGPLSESLISYRGLATGNKPQVAYCGMAKKSWLQDGKEIANPYYGSKMLRCGSIVEK